MLACMEMTPEEDGATPTPTTLTAAAVVEGAIGEAVGEKHRRPTAGSPTKPKKKKNKLKPKTKKITSKNRLPALSPLSRRRNSFSPCEVNSLSVRDSCSDDDSLDVWV